MKTQKVLWRSLLAAGLTAAAWAAPAADKPSALKELGPGTYQATVRALVCDGCGEFIQKTMSTQPGIEAVAVDQKSKRVMFQVKDKARVQVADLQKALDAAAGQMGMGADYTLENLQKPDSKPAGSVESPAKPRAERAHPQMEDMGGHHHH